jgi:hypothetical protein
MTGNESLHANGVARVKTFSAVILLHDMRISAKKVDNQSDDVAALRRLHF